MPRGGDGGANGEAGGGVAHGVDDGAPGLVEAAVVEVVGVRVALAEGARRPAGADAGGAPGERVAEALGGLGQVPPGGHAGCASVHERAGSPARPALRGAQGRMLPLERSGQQEGGRGRPVAAASYPVAFRKRTIWASVVHSRRASVVSRSAAGVRRQGRGGHQGAGRKRGSVSAAAPAAAGRVPSTRLRRCWHFSRRSFRIIGDGAYSVAREQERGGAVRQV